MSNITRLITDHLDIWTAADTGKKSGRGRASSNASSVYGIKKLRELILELAVRGKLVPQDANDEPASELLKRIQAEKAKLVAEGKIRKEKPPKAISADEIQFNLPENWVWTRLGSIGSSSTGRTPSTQDSSLYDGLMPFIGPGQISSACELLPAEKWLSETGKDETTIAKAGDILMVCIGGSIGKSAIADKEMGFNQQINCISPVYMESRFAHVSVMANNFQSKILEFASGSATPIINKSKWEELCIPLPPLAEQHRIVAKVDELMALCDQLEAQHSNAGYAHEQLVSHLLGTLTQSQDAADFTANWQRIATHFDTLFTTESSIDSLKQTLLQLAVMGKLVPQDPNDEPASELLKRIQAEKAKLVSEGKIKKDKPLAAIGEDEKLFDTPIGWALVRKAAVFKFLNGYAFKSETFQSSGVKLLRNVNVSHGFTDWSDVAHISNINAQKFEEYSLNVGDTVLTLDRPIITTGLKFAVISKSDVPCLLLQRVAKISSFSESVISDYLSIWLQSAFFTSKIDPGRSNGVPHISTTQVSNMLFALPPVVEQHRIVAKVGELMTLCNRLKFRITDARLSQQILADAVIARAVS